MQTSDQSQYRGEPSQGDQSADFDRAQGCGVKRNASTLTRLVASLTLTMTHAVVVA
jgi:hypothetical protein